MEYVLETEGLTKKYKNKAAVNKVSLHIKEGEIYGIVGRNGSGKTTIIRMITGLIKKTTGSYKLFGVKDTENIYSARKNISAVVESPSIYLNMGAYDNLLMQQKVLGKENQKEIEEVLKLINLYDVPLDKKAKDFSLGMRQRLGIGVAIIGNPKFLILDEPTNGLDPNGIKEIRELLVELNKKYGTTILISSHILSELSKFATSYGFIEEGKLLKEITAEEIEEECKKRWEVHVNSTSKVEEVLKSLEITDYKIISEEEFVLYHEIETTKLVLALKEKNVIVKNIKEIHDDLETYFIALLGGKK